MRHTPPSSPLNDHPGALWRVAAIAWLLCVLAVGWHQWNFWQQGRVDMNVLALLPEDEQAPEVGLATRKLVDGISRQVMLLVGGEDWSDVRAATALLREQLPAGDSGLQEQPLADGVSMAAALDFYFPWRDRLLTPEQRQMLAASDTPALAQRALTALYQQRAGAAVRVGCGPVGAMGAMVGATRGAKPCSPARWSAVVAVRRAPLGSACL